MYVDVLGVNVIRKNNILYFKVGLGYHSQFGSNFLRRDRMKISKKEKLFLMAGTNITGYEQKTDRFKKLACTNKAFASKKVVYLDLFN